MTQGDTAYMTWKQALARTKEVEAALEQLYIAVAAQEVVVQRALTGEAIPVATIRAGQAAVDAALAHAKHVLTKKEAT